MRHLTLLLVSSTAFLAASCSNNGRGQPAQLPQAPSGESPQKAPVQTEGLRSFPAVDLEGLEPAAVDAFRAIANEEICPCECPRSFGGCLQAGTRCEPAVLLGNWLADQLRTGTAPEQLAEQVTQEIAGGYSAPPKDLQLEGYATKGAPDAPYTIVEYADFECPHCKMASSVVGQLVQANPGKVRVVYKHFPLSFHVMAKVAAAAAEAAGRQGRFWEMHDAIFATQNMLDEDLIRGHAKAIGLDVERFETDWKDPAVIAKVDASRQEGEALGITATPAFFVNGRPFQLMRTSEAFSLRLQMEAARATSSCE